jgi:hypothetical protein
MEKIICNMELSIDILRAQDPMINQILALLPNLALQGFFGPKRLRPFNAAVRKASQRKNKETMPILLKKKKIHFHNLIFTNMSRLDTL